MIHRGWRIPAAGVMLRDARGARFVGRVDVWPVALGAMMGKLVPLVMVFGGALSACDDPCEKLQKKVCDDPVYYKANKRHCELLSEPQRREALPAEFCTSILDSLKR